MKKILTVAIACACLTGFSACNDFLEEKPKSSLTAPDYYQTEAQAQAINLLLCARMCDRGGGTK